MQIVYTVTDFHEINYGAVSTYDPIAKSPSIVDKKKLHHHHGLSMG
jgi:hypothetical protein